MPSPTPAQMAGNLQIFAKAVGLELADFQADSLQLRWRRLCLLGPRQSGKSQSLAALSLWWCFRRENQHVLLISAGQDASQRLYAMCQRAVSESPFLTASVDDETASELKLTNGSTIKSVPSSEAQIRGRSTDLLVCDESAMLDDELVESAATLTTLARPNAKLVFAGTGGQPGTAFHRIALAGEEGAADTETIVWAVSDAPWISPELVESARRTMPPAAFARELEARFADVEDDARLIPRAWIESAQRRELSPDGPRVLGVDIGHGGDLSVVCEMRGAGHARIVWYSHESDATVLAERLKQIYDEEPTAKMALDAPGGGKPVINILQRLGVPCVGYYPSKESPDRREWINLRAHTFWRLRERFREHKIDLDPKDHRLANQLASLTYTLAAGSGGVQIQSKTTMAKSPDFADSLAICQWAAGLEGLSEQIRRMDEANRRTAVEANRPRPSTEELLEREHTSTEFLWGGGRRGGWRSKLDADLPCIDGSEF